MCHVPSEGIPIHCSPLPPAGAKAGKLLLQLQKPNIPERFPIRVLQLNVTPCPPPLPARRLGVSFRAVSLVVWCMCVSVCLCLGGGWGVCVVTG